MPGWNIHLEVAKDVANILSRAGDMSEGKAPVANLEQPFSSFYGSGKTPQELSDIIRKYPNYYALGAIGPDIFFLLPDFKGKKGNFIAQLAQWVIELYDTLDEKVFKPWEDLMGPIEENNTEELSRLTGDLSNEISKVATYASGIITEAILGFATRLYDWFSLFGSGVGAGYDDQLFFWSDMFHYRNTNEFARDLFDQARTSIYTDEGRHWGRHAVVCLPVHWRVHHQRRRVSQPWQSYSAWPPQIRPLNLHKVASPIAFAPLQAH